MNRPAGPHLEDGERRILRARYRVALDGGHTRDCAFVFAYGWIRAAELDLSLAARCRCGERRRERTVRLAAA